MSQDLIKFLVTLDKETCSSCMYLTYYDDGMYQCKDYKVCEGFRIWRCVVERMFKGGQCRSYERRID